MTYRRNTFTTILLLGALTIGPIMEPAPAQVEPGGNEIACAIEPQDTGAPDSALTESEKSAKEIEALMETRNEGALERMGARPSPCLYDGKNPIRCSQCTEDVKQLIHATEVHLNNLHRLLERLKVQTEECNPYKRDPKAPEVSEYWQQQIEETEKSIKQYLDNLSEFRRDCPLWERQESQIQARDAGAEPCYPV